MSESEPISKTRATRAQLAKVIRRRPRVGLGTALLLSVAFATLATPLVALDLILASTGSPAFVAGQPAPVTVRVPHFEGFTDARYALRQGAVVVTRGQILKRADVALVRASPDEFEEITRFSALSAKTWNHPVLVDGVLYVRNSEEMAAFRLPREG